MAEKEKLKPISIATLQKADVATECPSDEEVATLIAALNDSIQSNAISPRSCLTLNGLTTWKAARVDVTSFSKASVIRVVEVYQNAGYFTLAFGESKRMETLWVSWDAALGAKKESPVTKARPPAELTPYTPACRDIVRVAGLVNKSHTMWNKKCCVAYAAAACLLNEEYVARNPLNETIHVEVRFPEDVPATALSAAVRELNVRFYHTFLDANDSSVMHVEYSPGARAKRFSGRAGFSVSAYPLTDMLRDGGVSPDSVLDAL